MSPKLIILFLIIPAIGFSQPDFNKYFRNNSLRFDFLLGGDSAQATVFPQQIKQEPYWGGPKKNLIDNAGYGSHRFRVFDVKTDSLIFSKGFCTLFQEWQTTAEAKKTTRAFYQAVIFPFPKNIVRLEIDARQRDNRFKTIYSSEIDPANYFILDEASSAYEVVKIRESGLPENKVDLTILAEGYTKGEMGKFVEDAGRMAGYLLAEPPFSEMQDKFNIYAVLTPSAESGTDIPGEHIYKNTFFNSTYYTFDIDRYLTTSDMKAVYDAAAVTPYDHVYVLVNTSRYGGGGFYNFVSVCTADNEHSKNVFIHEFGHGFAGLADEYYNSSVAYENYYNLAVEPWEPNLTTLVDFNKKWKPMVKNQTPIPTPRQAKFNSEVGVFEGGGYMSKGIYSPMMDCRMKSNEAKGFCPVCAKAVKQAIDFYTK